MRLRPLGVAVVALIVVPGALVGRAAAASDGGARLSSQGAVLTPAGHPAPVELAPGAPCQTLLGAGDGQCGIVAAPDGALLYTVTAGPVAEAGLASRPWTVTVYRAWGPGRWTASLRTRPGGGEPGPLFTAVTVRSADLTGNGQSLVVGYRSEGTGAFLGIDLVVGTTRGPRVAGHTVLDQGVALVQARQLVTYQAVYRSRDANCCPSSVERDVIQARGGSFVVASSRRLPTAQVKIPASDLG